MLHDNRVPALTLPSDMAVCASLVAGAAPDHHAAVMMASLPARLRLWPLYALDIEIRRAAAASAETLISAIRLHWWRDEIDRLASGLGGQGPVSTAFAPLMTEWSALHSHVHTMIDAWDNDCAGAAVTTTDVLATHIDATTGTLYWAAARLLGAPPNAEGAIRDFAWGAGLAEWLRSVPARTARGRACFPDESGAAVTALAREGLKRIERSHSAAALVPRAVLPALWAGWQADSALRAAARRPSLVLSGRLPDRRPVRAAALLWRSLTARY